MPQNFALLVEAYTMQGISVVASLLALAALLHCALQRSDAFGVAGPLSKGAWLAILAGTMLLSALGIGGGGGAGLGIFGIIGLIASLVYLLDIRPALKGTDTGPW
ncbi:MAG: DUF2516 family protein [Stackebrandtia sp.]